MSATVNTSTVLETALTLATAGIPLFPCNPNTKAPLTKRGFHDASTDLAKVEAWWSENPGALIGVPTGKASGFDALDVDPRHGGDAWLKANAGRLKGTRVHQTRSGGIHVIYRHADGLRCSAGKLAPGLDVRAEGGFVIWWPAHGLPSCGTEKAWPADLLDWVKTAKTGSISPVSGQKAALSDRLPPSADAVVALLTRLPNPLESTRDEWLSVLMATRGCLQALEAKGDLTLEAQTAIEDALFDWSDRWDGEQAECVRHKWETDINRRDALAGWGTLERIAERSIPGYRDQRAAADFATSPLPAEPLSYSSPSKLHWHGTKPYGNRRWLAYGLLPETGVALLSGQWGVGKTFAAVDLAAAVMTGTAFAGREVDRKCGVLWLAAEGETEVSDRLDIAMANRPALAGRLPFAWVDEVPVLTAPGASAKLTALVNSMNNGLDDGTRVGLVIVDTVAAAAGWRDEQDNAEAQVVMNVLRRVSRETGALVVAVDHYGKSVEAGTRGGSAKESAADAVLALLGEKRENGTVENRRLAVRKLRGGATGGETSFELRVEQIGTDDQGRPITTCAVDWTAAAARTKIEPVPRAAAEALAVLTKMVSEAGDRPVPEAEWRIACVAGRTVSAAESEQDRARCFRRAYELLSGRGLITPGDMVGLPGTVGALASDENGSLDVLTTGRTAGQSRTSPVLSVVRQDEVGGRTGQIPIDLSVVRPQPIEKVSDNPAKTVGIEMVPTAATDRPDPLALYAAVLRKSRKPVPAEIDAAVRDAARAAGVTMPTT